uniref:hypothetical protein n=1 Tax=Arhodomonas sp. AD133 TaxID=3415009 RepID=UPI003EBD9212
AYRPANAVPMKVALYDEPASRARANALAREQRADPNADLPDDAAPAYAWVYRPEMQFSVFDLQVNSVQLDDGTGQPINVIDLSDESAQVDLDSDVLRLLLTYELEEPEFPALESLGPERTLVFEIAGEERYATFTVGSDGTIVFDDLSFLEHIESDDFIAIRLLGNEDSENILWEYVVDVDLDIDSDNDNGYGAPDRSVKEDEIENTPIPLQPGKLMVVHTKDSDGDGLLDPIDFDGSDLFAPVVLELPDFVEPATAAIVFQYRASDPSQVSIIDDASGRSIHLPAGIFRIWRKQGDRGRDVDNILDGGDYIPPGTPIPAEELGFRSGVHEVELYVEAVRSADAQSRLRLEANLAPLTP